MGKIIEAQQPRMHNELKKNRKHHKRRGKNKNLSFYDVIELMQHDSYERHNGAIRQKKRC